MRKSSSGNGPLSRRLHRISTASNLRKTDAEIKLATTREELLAAWHLIYKQYLLYDYTATCNEEIRVNQWTPLPNTYTVVAKIGTKVVGTVSYIMDSAAKLPSDEIAEKELNGLRRSGRRLCEVSGLAVDTDQSDRTIVMDMFQYGLPAAADFLGATDYIITINPRHLFFYKKLLCFTQVSGTREYAKVRNAPGICMRLNLETTEDIYYRKYSHKTGRNNLHHFFFQARKADYFRKIPSDLRKRGTIISMKSLSKLLSNFSNLFKNPAHHALFFSEWRKYYRKGPENKCRALSIQPHILSA